jgi:hypothetical protein
MYINKVPFAIPEQFLSEHGILEVFISGLIAKPDRL